MDLALILKILRLARLGPVLLAMSAISAMVAVGFSTKSPVKDAGAAAPTASWSQHGGKTSSDFLGTNDPLEGQNMANYSWI